MDSRTFTVLESKGDIIKESMDDSSAHSPPAILLIVLVLAVVLQPIVPLRRRKKGFDAFPWLTALLVFLNVVLFFATDMGRKEDTLFDWGLTIKPFRPWTLISYQFLHGSLDHLAGNMAGLWLLGPHLEEALGRKRYLFYYLGSGVVGAILHSAVVLITAPQLADEPLIGASGAIFGVMGLFAVRFWRTRVRLFVVFKVPAVVAVGVFAAIQVWSALASISGRSDNVAYWAHVGGFAFGAGLAFLMRVKDESRREYGLEDAEKALAGGELHTALAHYQRLLLDTPDDPGLHHTAALLAQRLNQPVSARRHFEDAVVLYARQGPPEALVRAFYDGRQALPDLSVAPPVLARVATAAEQTHQYQLAHRALSEVALGDPGIPEAEMALLRLGRLLAERLGEPVQAVPIFREFLRRYPASERTHLVRRALAEAERAAVS